MLLLTTLQISKLNELARTAPPQSYTISQKWRGPDNPCDHIHVDLNLCECRIDLDGNVFDIQSKEPKT